MANFVKRQAARESVEGTGTVVPDGLELPHESVEGILADLKEKENETDRDLNEAGVLEEDTQETEGQMEVLDEAEAAANGEGDPDNSMEAGEDMTDEEVEAVDVAQESIRQRWALDRQSIARESYGSRKKRQVARESVWEDIKGLLRRFWEWMKEQGRKIKDRWIAFTNAGKSLQKRAKKYTEQIKKLGKLKDGKDTISGGFVAKLSVAGSFKGNDIAVLKEETSSSPAEAYDELLEMVTHMAESIELMSSGRELSAQEKAELDAKANEKAAKAALDAIGKTNHIGNTILEQKMEDDGSLSIVLTDYEGNTEDEVKTPTVSQLSAATKFMEELGKSIEKAAKAYHATAQKRDKLERVIEKSINNIDKIKVDDMTSENRENISKARRCVSSMSKLGSEMERMHSRLMRTVSDGISAYIAAGIVC
ncbi:MAG: hypothetical protein ACRCWC_12565, partial [Plesiomonas shigelloides]